MKKKHIEDFFKLFIKNYLVGDILVLNKIKKDKRTGLNACTIPQAMSVLSGIDLLGYLFGNNKATDETEKHIFEFYRIANNFLLTKYNEGDIKKLVLYRHGMMHNFFPKFHAEKIGICKSESESLFIKETFNGIEIESLNVRVLTKDFLFVVLSLEKTVKNGSDDVLFDNILAAIHNLVNSNELALTTTKETTVNITSQNKRN